METVAIIGTGIAGMSAAYALRKKCRLSLFESEYYVGGHTRTETFEINGKSVSVDTGFMVYNEVTYPMLTQLFKELEVETAPTDMSFGVQHKNSGLEYCGSGFLKLFAQLSNLFNPKFWGMIRQIFKFNRLANATIDSNELVPDLTLKDFSKNNQLNDYFLEHYLLPMTSAIWSTPPNQMLEFPAKTLFQFMKNHGLLGVQTQHQWRTVVGGSKKYREKLIDSFKDKIRTNCRIISVRRIPDAVELTDEAGEVYRFKRVIIATHADQALRLLEAPTSQEKALLSQFQYTDNKVTLHTDSTVMPKSKRAWASWNYSLEHKEGQTKAATHYWMNSLQPIKEKQAIFVSVNGQEEIDSRYQIKQFNFFHPVFTDKTWNVQKDLPKLNQNGKIYYAGSYFRYGFHEDALMAGTDAAMKVLEDQKQRNAQLAI